MAKVDRRCVDEKGVIVVTAGILLRNSKVLIGKRKSTGTLPGKWEFPGGKVEPHETPEICLARELKEELDIKAHVGDFLWQGDYQYDFGNVRLLFYRVYWDGSDIASKDHDEVIWASLDRLSTYDFAPADWPFVERLVHGGLAAM